MRNHQKDLWSYIQRKTGSNPDGIPGPKTAREIIDFIDRLEADFVFVTSNAMEDPDHDQPEEEWIDERSLKNLNTLISPAREYFVEILRLGKEIIQYEKPGLDYRLISGTRSYEEQDALYAKGRTASGNIVTNARGGYSNHNFGIAGDFGCFGPSGEYLDSSDGSFARNIHGAVAKAVKARYGDLIEWGGDWTSIIDHPHFQIDTGLTLAEMRERVKKGTPVWS